ncbi:MAG TPA: hypothetical protein VF456_22935 [Vicinamibacterales bacterium]
MRLADFAITAVVVAGLSAPAMAQEGSAQPVQTNPPVTNQAPVPATNNNYNNNSGYDSGNNWVASAFVGTNFGTGFTGTNSNFLGIDTSNTNSSINFGGQIAYLWGGWAGVEALAEFSPSFQLADILFENNPDVNTFVGNGILAHHFGSRDQYMPYVSGGIGAMTLRSTIFLFSPTDLSDLTPIGTASTNGSRFAWDIGAGTMGFSGRWGFRGDVRYYRATSTSSVDVLDIGTGSNFTNAVLSGLRFWKANVGVAYRW